MDAETEVEPVAPEGRPLTVDELLPFCSPLTREGIGAAVANMRATAEQQARMKAEQRVAELEAQLANHNGTVKAGT